MSGEPTIHVFLGAPRLLPSTVEAPEDGEAEPGELQGEWRTMELHWQGGKLTRKLPEAGGDGNGRSPDREEPARGTKHRRVRMIVDTPRSEEEPECGKGTERSGCVSAEANLPGPECTLDPVELGTRSESVQEYLDFCFPAAQPEPGPETLPPGSEPSSTPVAASLSIRTEYLSAWTVSHVIRLRSRLVAESQRSTEEASHSQILPGRTPTSLSVASGSLELYSPATPRPPPEEGSPQTGSPELFPDPQLSERLEEGVVVLEFIHDGVLCSQALPRLEPVLEPRTDPLWAGSPPPARTTLKPQPSKQSRPSPEAARATPNQVVVPARGRTTPLAGCVAVGTRHSVLVGVVHPCHLKEIRPKSGLSTSASIPLASIVVTDQSGFEMKVVLWKQAAFWVLMVHPGDILLITGVMVHEDKWRGETVLQSSYASRLLNLGQVTTTSSPPVPGNVDGRTLRSLIAFLRARRPLLVALPPRVPQDPNSVHYVRLGFLLPDTLVHARLRVTRTQRVTAWRPEAEGTSRTGGVQKAVLTVKQGDGQRGAVVLWGTALAWLPRISKHKDAVWDFHMLLVRENVTSGLLELHSTPWGTCQPLAPKGLPAPEMCGESHAKTNLELDLHTLLSQKYTGDVELKVQITTFQFQSSPSQDGERLLDSDTPLERLLDTMAGDVTFTGCGRCAVELYTDDNGIYLPCYPCLPHTGVRQYYRPVLLTVREGQTQVQVRVPPALVQKVLLDIPPYKLGKTVGPGSMVRYTQVVADRVHALLSRPRPSFLLTVRSHFVCDENSFPTVQDFLLLDLQLLGE